MTDYRLSALAPLRLRRRRPQKMYRLNAPLARRRRRQREASPGGLTVNEKARMEETLTDLNREVYGGADALPDASGAPAERGAGGELGGTWCGYAGGRTGQAQPGAMPE